jgi:hypothetical protein
MGKPSEVARDQRHELERSAFFGLRDRQMAAP